MQVGKGREVKPGRQGSTGNVRHVSLARQGTVHRSGEFRAETPGRQCCAGSTEKSGQGRAGQPGQADNLVHAGREGQGRQAMQAVQYRKCRARKLGKAGQGR